MFPSFAIVVCICGRVIILSVVLLYSSQSSEFNSIASSNWRYIQSYLGRFETCHEIIEDYVCVRH